MRGKIYADTIGFTDQKWLSICRGLVYGGICLAATGCITTCIGTGLWIDHSIWFRAKTNDACESLRQLYQNISEISI